MSVPIDNIDPNINPLDASSLVLYNNIAMGNPLNQTVSTDPSDPDSIADDNPSLDPDSPTYTGNVNSNVLPSAQDNSVTGVQGRRNLLKTTTGIGKI